MVALDQLRCRPATVPDIGCRAAAAVDGACGVLLRRSCDGPPRASSDAGWRVPIRSMSVPQRAESTPHRPLAMAAHLGDRFVMPSTTDATTGEVLLGVWRSHR